MPGPSWWTVLTTWRPSWGVDLLLLVLLAAYLVAARCGPDRWPVHRTASFVGALAGLVLTFDSGVDVFGHGSFAVHMVMHLLLIMVVPALWVGGHPLELARRGLHGRAAARWDAARDSRAARALTFPLTVLGAYALVVVLTHLTGFMEAMAASPPLHRVEQVLYLAAGLLFFSTALGVDAGPTRPSYFMRFVLMLVAMGVDTLVGVVLMLSPRSPFPSYLADDVHLGGALMWVAGDGLMMLIMVLLGRLWVSDTTARVDFGPWLESARRSTISNEETVGAETDLDSDDEALASYNRMLARLQRGERR